MLTYLSTRASRHRGNAVPINYTVTSLKEWLISIRLSVWKTKNRFSLYFVVFLYLKPCFLLVLKAAALRRPAFDPGSNVFVVTNFACEGWALTYLEEFECLC